MSLIDQVRIRNFRSIVDSGWIDLEDDLTTLVGPNEAGKTSVLEALRLFGLDQSFNDDDVCDYVDSPDLDDTPIVSINLTNVAPSSYGSQARSPVNGPSLLNIDEDVDITLRKYFDGTYSVESDEIKSEITQYESSRRERSQNLQSELQDLAGEILDKLPNEAIENNKEQIESIANQAQKPVRRYSTLGRSGQVDIVRVRDQFQTLKDQLLSIQTKSLPGSLRSQTMELERKIANSRPAGDLFVDHFYSALLYQDPGLIQDSVDLKTLERETDNLYNDLMEFIEISPDNLETMDPRARRSIVDAKMDEFTERFANYWTQGNIQFNLDFVNGDVTLLISDESGKEQYVSQRSRGFREFLTFFVQLLAKQESNSYKNQIILLDDPGLHLHPERQKDLMGALGNLGDDNQLIYSTHSPYMLEKSRLNGFRIITSENGNEGTVIESNLSAARNLNGDSLEPVRGALGATFSDSLFGSNQTILVEGYTDRIYLKRFAKIFHSSGDVRFDQDAGIIDMGGGAKWEKYTRFLQSEGYEYVLVLDYDGADDNSSSRIEDDEYVSMNDVVRIDSILQETISAGHQVAIEDLFAREDFIDFVCGAYAEISHEDLEGVGEGTESIVKEIQIRFEKIRGQENRDLDRFSKRKIADEIDQILSSGSLDEAISESTVTNFQNLVESIKTKLPTEIDADTS